GEAFGRTGRLGCGRQRGPNPWRQRVCARIQDFPDIMRRAHSLDFRGRGRNPGTGNRATAPGWGELRTVGAEMSASVGNGTNAARCPAYQSAQWLSSFAADGTIPAWSSRTFKPCGRLPQTEF